MVDHVAPAVVLFFIFNPKYKLPTLGVTLSTYSALAPKLKKPPTAQMN